MRHTSVLKLATLLLAFAIGAWACCSNPGQEYQYLQFGPGVGTGVVCPGTHTDAALGCGLSPNPTPLNHLDVFNSAPSGTTDLDMFRLIIGVPVSSQTQPGAPTIDAVNVYNPGFATVLDGTDRTGTFCGYFSAGSTNPYSACANSGQPNLSNGGGNSFAAWAAADAAVGVNPAYFALYYYNLDSVGNNVGQNVGDLDAGGRYDVFFKAPMALGTIEIAYGCASLSGGCPCEYTPFTQAGQATPEPASWLLVAGAALALLLLPRLRAAKAKARQ